MHSGELKRVLTKIGNCKGELVGVWKYSWTFSELLTGIPHKFREEAELVINEGYNQLDMLKRQSMLTRMYPSATSVMEKV